MMRLNIALPFFSFLISAVILAAEPAVALEKHGLDPPPEIPTWPDVFTIQYDVYVEDYGAGWKSHGALYYHWPTKTFRADYIDWCLPLFDDDGLSAREFNNYTCSFLATRGNMYFVNHTSPEKKWKENDCCLFAGGLAATPPDWMKNDQYNGTDNIDGYDVDVWWFLGTNDPSEPCYGYWNVRDKIKTPFRFFGLSSIGPTILDYHDFIPDKIEGDIDISMPLTGCSKECEPPVLKKKMEVMRMRGNGSVKAAAPWPDWPSCE